MKILLLSLAGAALLVVLLALGYLWVLCYLGSKTDQHGGDLQ